MFKKSTDVGCAHRPNSHVIAKVYLDDIETTSYVELYIWNASIGVRLRTSTRIDKYRQCSP